MAEKVLFILYVANQAVSADFYRVVLDNEPVLDVPGMTEFSLNSSASLGLMPQEGAMSFLGGSVPRPSEGSGIPRCEIYLFVDEPARSLEKLVSSGGRHISAPGVRSWGDEVAYGLDPDGHVLAFARKTGNP